MHIDHRWHWRAKCKIRSGGREMVTWPTFGILRPPPCRGWS